MVLIKTSHLWKVSYAIILLGCLYEILTTCLNGHTKDSPWSCQRSNLNLILSHRHVQIMKQIKVVNSEDHLRENSHEKCKLDLISFKLSKNNTGDEGSTKQNIEIINECQGQVKVDLAAIRL